MGMIFANFIPVLDTNIYASGDVLFETVKIENVFEETGQSGIVRSITIADEDSNTDAFDIVFLEENISIGTINGADTLVATDADKIFGIFSVEAADFKSLANAEIATEVGVNIPVQAEENSRALYVAGISRSTGTYTASGLEIKIGIDV